MFSYEKTRSYMPEFVYGSIDGLVTTFAIVTSAVGAGFSPGVVVIMGFANVFADAFSMGSSSYLSSESEHAVHDVTHGKSPLSKAVVTFGAFVLVGMIPMVPFLIAMITPHPEDTWAIGVSVVLTGIAFAAIGYASGVVAEKPPIWAACRTVIIGSIAAIIAFIVGRVLGQVFGTI